MADSPSIESLLAVAKQFTATETRKNIRDKRFVQKLRPTIQAKLCR